MFASYCIRIIHSRFALIVHLAQNSFSVYVSVPATSL